MSLFHGPRPVLPPPCTTSQPSQSTRPQRSSPALVHARQSSNPYPQAGARPIAPLPPRRPTRHASVSAEAENKASSYQASGVTSPPPNVPVSRMYTQGHGLDRYQSLPSRTVVAMPKPRLPPTQSLYRSLPQPGSRPLPQSSHPPIQLATNAPAQSSAPLVQRAPLLALAPLKSHLDTALRASAERIATELAGLRAVTSRMLCAEQAEADGLRRRCAQLQRERDFERVKFQLLERPAGRAQGVKENVSPMRGMKRGRSEGVLPSPASAQNLPTPPASTTLLAPVNPPLLLDTSTTTLIEGMTLSYPSPSTSSKSSPRASTSSLPPPNSAPAVFKKLSRSASASSRQVLARVASPTPRPSSAPAGIELGLGGERPVSPHPSKRRRVSLPLEEADASPVEISGLARPFLPPTSLSANLANPTSPIAIVSDVHQYIDLLYAVADDQIVCRACISRNNRARAAGASTCPPARFGRGASWNSLASHGTVEHADECVALARLGPRQVMEMRRRMAAGGESGL